MQDRGPRTGGNVGTILIIMNIRRQSSDLWAVGPLGMHRVLVQRAYSAIERPSEGVRLQ